MLSAEDMRYQQLSEDVRRQLIKLENNFMDHQIGLFNHPDIRVIYMWNMQHFSPEAVRVFIHRLLQLKFQVRNDRQEDGKITHLIIEWSPYHD